MTGKAPPTASSGARNRPPSRDDDAAGSRAPAPGAEQADRWEHFDHQADIGVRGLGGTLEGAFEQAALALSAVVADPARVAPRRRVHIRCREADTEMLLVDWLNAVIYAMTTRRMLFGAFSVRIRDGRLTGVACGEALDPARHQPAVEPKGASYTALCVRRDAGDHWIAQCVVDV